MVSIILVNHNGARWLTKCLSSLAAHHGAASFEVVVVDNASTDDSVATIRAECPSAAIIECRENLGFSRGNNLAVRHASGDVLLLLNTDTYFTENVLDPLSDFLLKHPRVAAVGPRLRFEDGNHQLSAGRQPTLTVELLDKLWYGIDRRCRLWTGPLNEALWRGTREVGWISGACMMMRRNAFTSAGGFDESLFMYFEDKDLCKRLADRGWKIVYHPATSIVHLLGASAQAVPGAAGKRIYRQSQLRYYKKHRGGIQAMLVEAYLRLSREL